MSVLTDWLHSLPSWLAVCLAIAIMTAAFLPFSLLRPIDGDEGYYLLASRLVTEGQVLYHDFFYPQMPLLPYVYGGWMHLTSFSWYAARTLSAILAIIVGVLLYHHIADIYHRPTYGLWAVFVYCFSIMVLDWYVVAKTYVLSTLLLFAAYTVLSRANRTTWWVYPVSGFLFGLATETRLFFFGVILAFIVEINRQVGWRSRQLLLFLAGLVIALLPLVALAWPDWDTFLFNNLLYHQQRSEFSWGETVYQKLKIARVVTGLRSPGRLDFGYIQPLWLLAIIIYIAWFARRQVEPSLAGLIVVLLFLISLLPSPTYSQYFSVLIPFAVVCYFELLHPFNQKKWIQRGAVLISIVYCVVSVSFIYKYWERAAQPPLSNWNISEVRDVTAYLNQSAIAGEPIVTWWPGYLVESSAKIVPGLENHFGLDIAESLTADQRARYHLITESEVSDLIANQQIKLIIVGNWIRGVSPVPLLTSAGYKRIREVHHAEFFASRSVSATPLSASQK